MTLYEVLSIGGALFGLLLAIIGFLARNTYVQDKREIEENFKSFRAKNEKQDDENKKVVDRLHQQELANQALRYELQLTNRGSQTIERDVEEIKGAMVTKVEFNQLKSSIDDIGKKLQSPGRYGSSSPPTPFPERKNR